MPAANLTRSAFTVSPRQGGAFFSRVSGSLASLQRPLCAAGMPNWMTTKRLTLDWVAQGRQHQESRRTKSCTIPNHARLELTTTSLRTLANGTPPVKIQDAYIQPRVYAAICLRVHRVCRWTRVAIYSSAASRGAPRVSHVTHLRVRHGLYISVIQLYMLYTCREVAFHLHGVMIPTNESSLRKV